MTVTKRIKVIESLVPYGTRLLDVGSDHALLPISLCLSGVITQAVISDINQGPLDSGRRNVATLCPALKASFVLSDGFAAVEKGSYDRAAICGMGGELIARIIADGGDKAHCPLILQAMTHAEDLRAYLWQNGFEITEERFAREGRRIYCIMAAEYTGKYTPYGYADLFLGIHRPKTAEFYYYAQKVAEAAEKRLNGYKLYKDAENTALTEALIEDCRKYF